MAGLGVIVGSFMPADRAAICARLGSLPCSGAERLALSCWTIARQFPESTAVARGAGRRDRRHPKLLVEDASTRSGLTGG